MLSSDSAHCRRAQEAAEAPNGNLARLGHAMLSCLDLPSREAALKKGHSCSCPCVTAMFDQCSLACMLYKSAWPCSSRPLQQP